MIKRIYNLPHAIPTKRVKVRFLKLFADKRIHRLLGSNLALAVIAGVLLPGSSNASFFRDFTNQTVSAETIKLTTERGLQIPFQNPRISQGFYLFHPGIDLTGITDNEEIHPIMNGTIAFIQYSKFDYGNAVIVDHGNRLTSLYAHLSKINVSINDKVTTSTILGTMGATGHATGPHLHLEIRDHERPIDPTTLLPINLSLSQR